MKKRKAPILLVSLLVVLVGGVVIYGMYQNSPAKSDMTDPVTGEHETPTSDDIGNSVVKNTPPARNMKPSMPGHSEQAGPSISLPKDMGVYQKPKKDGQGSVSSLREVSQ